MEGDTPNQLGNFIRSCAIALVQEIEDMTPAFPWAEETRLKAVTVMSLSISGGINSITSAMQKAIDDHEW